jgi:host factor-I protein
VIGPEIPQVGLALHRNVPSNKHAHVVTGGHGQTCRLRGDKDSRGAEGRASKKSETRAMAGDRAQNLQDTFLNHVRKAKIPLTIFLVNGVKLQGVVTWFDNFCVLLRRDGHSQLVYKHAISTIMPGHPIQLFEGAEEATAGEKV